MFADVRGSGRLAVCPPLGHGDGGPLLQVLAALAGGHASRDRHRHLLPADGRRPPQVPCQISSSPRQLPLLRFPRLKVCFAHGGGSFPYTVGRIQHGYNVSRSDRHYYVDIMNLKTVRVLKILDRILTSIYLPPSAGLTCAPRTARCRPATSWASSGRTPSCTTTRRWSCCWPSWARTG